MSAAPAEKGVRSRRVSGQFRALSALTALEAARQPLCLLLTTGCVLLTSLTPILSTFRFGEEGKLARDSGLAFHFVFGLFIAGYAASTTLAREIHRGTLLAVLSKPVGRYTLFLAKFVGVAGVVVAFSACATLATLLGERVAERLMTGDRVFGRVIDWWTAVRLLAVPAVAFALAGWHHYRSKGGFTSWALSLHLIGLIVVLLVSGLFDRGGNWAPYDMAVQSRIVPAAILVTVALIVVAALAVSLSTRLTTVPTISICSLFLGLGLVSESFVGGSEGPATVLTALLHRITPNWQHFWVCDALDGGGTIPSAYVADAALYGAALCVAILCLGMLSFRSVDLK